VDYPASFYELPAGPGAALFGSDYTLSIAGLPADPGLIAINSGSTTATLTVTPLQDTRVEGTEAVVLNLLPGPGYVVVSPSSATIYIDDDDNPSPQSPTYTISDIGLYYTPSHGLAINYYSPAHAPVVVGDFWPSSQFYYEHAFYWVNGTFSDLGTLESASYAQSWALGINDSQVVVGYATFSGAFLPFKSINRYMTALDTLGLSYNRAAAINNNNRIVGNCNTNGADHATVWDNGAPVHRMGSLVNLDDPSRSSYAFGVNNNGRIVGKSMFTPTGSSFHAFRAGAFGSSTIDIDPSFDDLGTIVASDTFASEADGINDLDEVVGGAKSAERRGCSSTSMRTPSTTAGLSSMGRAFWFLQKLTVGTTFQPPATMAAGCSRSLTGIWSSTNGSLAGTLIPVLHVRQGGPSAPNSADIAWLAQESAR
jgi:probable HAF family extracellular repeat protein